MENSESTEHHSEYNFLPGHVEIISNRGCCGKLRYFYHKYRFCMCIHLPSLLIKSQWNIPASVWITYRVIMAILAFSNLIGIHLYIFMKGYCLGGMVFIFLTQWGLLILAATFILQAFIVIVYRSYLTMEPVGMDYVRVPWPMTAMWILININLSLAFGITLAFWTFLYPGGADHSLFWLRFLQHGMTAIFVFIDLCMIALPIRWAHFYQPSIFGLSYLFLTLCLYLSKYKFFSNDNTIYRFLNWDKPLTTFLSCVLGGIAVISLLHCFVSLICFLRMKTARRIYNHFEH